jgi:hypothetical protein
MSDRVFHSRISKPNAGFLLAPVPRSAGSGPRPRAGKHSETSSRNHLACLGERCHAANAVSRLARLVRRNRCDSAPGIGSPACVGRLSSVHLRRATAAFGSRRRDGAGVYGAELSHVASVAGFSHVHVYSCADAANVCLFVRLLFGLSYSLTLHGLLRDYGPNQRDRWRHAGFAIAITQRPLQEVQHELIGALPE